MMESVQAFLVKIKEQSHVLQLIKDIDYLTIKLVADGSSISFAIANQNVFILDNEDEEIRTCKIQGKIKDVEDLLKGKEKLRSLEKRGRLQISAPFRTILLIESLFYLTKSENPIINTI
jgi:uncharacterized protein YjiK